MALRGNISNPIPADSLPFSVFSLMVWGSPGSFGVEDKETRIAALGAWIAQDTEHDVWLLNDLWMRPDHDTIKMLLPEGTCYKYLGWSDYIHYPLVSRLSHDEC